MVSTAWGVDFTGGEMQAVPVKEGKAPKIDGDLSDWDLSAQEPVYISAQTAGNMNAEWAVMYDDEALYLSARVALPGRPYSNRNNPQDAFWNEDILQVRMSFDPALEYPLDGKRDEPSDRIAHISFWKNNESGQSFLHFNRGVKFNKGQLVNPEGSEVKIVTNGDGDYVMEAKIPWSVMTGPGGKNPFKAGQSAAFLAETLWIGGDKARAALCYRINPGVFGFSRANSWGKLTFAEKSPGNRVRPAMAEILAAAKAEATVEKPKVGVPLELVVPDEGLKVSVNILGKDGSVIREVIAGEQHPKGKLTVPWDGRDAFGKVLPPGTYQWGAYFRKPLKAEYQGAVGSSGDPYYKTMDGKGGWGGDHSDPIDAGSEGQFLYLLWPVSEAGQALVKTGFDGKVVWRKNPFVGGGFGPFYAVGANDKYVYLARGNDAAFLVRLDAKTGALLTWGDNGPGEVPIYSGTSPVPVPAESTPVGVTSKKGALPLPEGIKLQPDPMGLAVLGEQVFVSCYSQNKIYVADAGTGKVAGELSCPGPRGLAAGPGGDLFAVSYVPGKNAEVVRFGKATGNPATVIRGGLEAPFDVAVAADGSIAVTDLGKSQQVKIFDGTGKAVKTLGVEGGRPWQGRYDPAALAFLRPAGLTVDAEGAVVVAESSPPKVFSRINLSDGKLINRWYGPGVYWNGTWPMPDNPRNIFYQLVDAIGRAELIGPEKGGVPNAYWAPEKAGYEHVGSLESGIPQPEVIRAKNGNTYFVQDCGMHAVYLLKDDLLKPVATWLPVSGSDKKNPLKKNYLEVWIDRNGDGQVQKNEQSQLAELADGKPVPAVSAVVGSMHMEPNGDLFFTTSDNCILKIPARSFGNDGMIEWESKQASLAVPQVMPGLERMFTTYRQGLLGVRLDGEGNLYTLFNTKLKGTGGAFDYPDEAYSSQMMNGMGHTSSFNVVKFAKFDSKGRLLWLAGRKATAGAAPGEMYHFWNMAGLVNDKYVAGGSEWGQIYLYTHDGFFVDALMNNPGEVTPPGPYTFGGETSGGRVAYFPETGELWAYSSGMAYKVAGFSKGMVEGESRASGSVVLDKVYELPRDRAESIAPLVLAKLQGDPMKDSAAWEEVPVSALMKNGKQLASAQMGYDRKFFYARIRVTDDSPMENGATQDPLAFKGGDTAGLVLGPDRESDKPGVGDVRFMVAKIGNKVKLIAMKAETGLEKMPFDYETPAGGKWSFEFAGEVPGAQVDVQPSSDGYVATFAVPLFFLEFNLAAGASLRGDIEVRLSGAGQRGLQAVSRNYLFTPDKAQTTMVDDIPTEARLYPAYWGPVEVR